jgi:4-hydroxy-2-oxoheptanedioate aldolase
VRVSQARERMSNNEPVINGWCGIPNSISAETLARQGFDSVTVDLQHGLVDYQAAVTMLQAISQTDATPLARVPWLEPGIIMKMLDAGAYGIICPMVNTVEDAKMFVAACSYAPDGMRSFGPTRALMYAGADYATHANATILKLAMIETTQALDNMEEIMAVPGLSGVYVGPSDLSLSMGYTPKLDQEEPAVVEKITAILDCAKRHKVFAGIHCLEASYARRMLDQGFNLTTIGSDNRLMAAAAQAALAEVRNMAPNADAGGPY